MNYTTARWCVPLENVMVSFMKRYFERYALAPKRQREFRRKYLNLYYRGVSVKKGLSSIL